MVRNFLVHRKGQSLVEYALILVLIALFVLLVLKTVGIKVPTSYPTIDSVSAGTNLLVSR